VVLFARIDLGADLERDSHHGIFVAKGRRYRGGIKSTGAPDRVGTKKEREPLEGKKAVHGGGGGNGDVSVLAGPERVVAGGRLPS